MCVNELIHIYVQLLNNIRSRLIDRHHHPSQVSRMVIIIIIIIIICVSSLSLCEGYKGHVMKPINQSIGGVEDVGFIDTIHPSIHQTSQQSIYIYIHTFMHSKQITELSTHLSSSSLTPLLHHNNTHHSSFYFIILIIIIITHPSTSS